MTYDPAILLYINGVEVGSNMEWSMTTEEVLGGTGRYTILVQDRTNTWEPQPHWSVKALINGGPLDGWVLAYGEIISPPADLVTGKEWRTWKLDCADWNGEIPQRLVGALDGKTWIDDSGLGIFTNIDPFASSLRTDKLTVQQLLDHYFRVDGQAAETDTFVGEYLTDFMKLTWTYSDLQRALEEMAAFVVENLQFWLDPDLFFHWVTIPAWQDIASEMATLEEDASTTALLFAEAAIDYMELAPFEFSGDVEPDPANGILGFSKLSINPDGANMPEQVYVRGGTGYVYNAPPIPPDEETKTVVSSPVVGTEGTYQLTILSTTKLWHVDSTGYVSVTYASVAAGGPWPVKWVSVPWNEARNKGGNYWKFLTGPHVGLLADDHTNKLTGYGSIRVELVAAAPGDPGDPQIGIGGTGWSGEVTQDPNKRQTYLQAPISTTKDLRDSFGGQTLYRGQFATLRGQIEFTGYDDPDTGDRVSADGWRAGQLVKITDQRLPADMTGKYFVIQRVKTSLVPMTKVRKYTLDFGDGPTNRYSYRASKQGEVQWPPPMNQIFVDAFDLTPGINNSQIVSAQLVNGSGQPWSIEGKVVEWSLFVYNAAGVLQTGQGSIDPEVSTTDSNGKARTTLVTGSTPNLVYYVLAQVRAT